MKTGKFITSVALATLAAACTNETMQLEPQAPGAGNRPMVNVALSFDENAVELGNSETRLAFEQINKGWQWTFKPGDKIGALLMDTWDGVDCGIKHFNLVDYVHTNYAFIKREDGKWITPENSPVCEGNYFFYFPYNDKFSHRGYVGWDVNPVQKQYDEEGNLWQMQSVKDNQKWLGYNFVKDELEGKVNSVNFEFVPIFAMPTFDIVNKAADLKVNKLVVRVTSKANTGEGEHSLMATTMALTPATRGFDNVNQKWEGMTFNQKVAEMWKRAQSYSYDSQADEIYQWPVNEGNSSLAWDYNGKSFFPLNEDHTDKSIKKAPTYEYVADFTGVKGGYNVEQMGHIQAILTMPGGLYAYGNAWTFEALLYVTSKAGDDYVVRIDLGKPQTMFGNDTSNYDDIASGAANKFLKPGMFTKYKAEFDAAAMQSYDITDFKAVSTEDLLWYLNEAEGDGIYDLVVRTSGSRVVLNKEVEDVLAEKPYIRLHVDGKITIGEDASKNAINRLYFDKSDINTKLTILNEQEKDVEKIVDTATGQVGKNKVLGNCEITVEKGGKLTTADGVEIKAPVINNGTVATGDVTGTVTNAGEMTAKAIVGNVNNSGKLSATQITGDVTNSGSGNLKATKIVGNVNNSGELEATEIVGKLTNSGTATVVGKVSDRVVNTGTATVGSVTGNVENNAGTITLSGTNYNTVGNKAIMNITGNATFAEPLYNENTLNVNSNIVTKGIVNSGTINIADGKSVEDKTLPAPGIQLNIQNKKGATIVVGTESGAKGLDKDKLAKLYGKITNNGTINNYGDAKEITNAGSMVTGSNSYTTIVGKDQNGTVDNSLLGDISYADVSQTVILSINDISEITVDALNDMIKKADANKLIIKKGTINVGSDRCDIVGHISDDELGYFSKGIELGTATTQVEVNSDGGMLVWHADGVTVAGTLFANTHSELVFMKESSAGTTLTVNGLLNIADHATVRGGMSASLQIAGNGKIENAGTIKYATSTLTNFTGNAIVEQ